MNDLLRYPVAYCVVGVALAAAFQPIRADWWGLLVLGLLISLYGFLAKGDKDARRLEVGDNCYFIGFVYTLSVITASLVFDADELLAGTDTLHPLLKTVGIALGTSVIGMTWRFGLTHDVRVSEDAFQDAVREAAIAAAGLKGVLEQLQEATRSASSTIDDIATKAGVKLEQLVEETRSRMHNAAVEAAGALAALGEATASNSQQQAETVADLTKRSAEAMQALQATTRATTEDVGQALAATLPSLRDYAGTMEASARRAGDALEEGARQALARLSQGVAEALTANTFADARKAMDAAVATHAQTAAAVQRTLAESVSGLNEATDLATARAEEARRTLASVQAAPEQAGLNSASTAVARLREAVAALNEQLPALATHQTAASEAAANYREQLNDLATALAALPQPPSILPPEPEAEHRAGWWSRLFRRS